MQERLAHTLFDEGLVKKTDRILCAVSGGADSMVMSYLLHRIGLDIVIAHCNFQLRDSESDADESFVSQFCSENNIPFVYKRFNTKAYSRANKLSIQEAARKLRYDWFEEQKEQHKCDWICTAHNLSDNAETILINQIRGTGIKGLTGIPVQRDNILRPMLTFSAKEIRTYANEQNVAYRIDSSNASDTYMRNALRHHVTPELMKIDAGFEQTFADNAARIQEASTLLDTFISEFKKQHITVSSGNLMIPKNELLSFPHPHIILSKLVTNAGFESDQLKQLIASNTVGRRIESDTHSLYVDRKHLVLKSKATSHPTLHLKTLGSYQFGQSSITISVKRKAEITIPLSKNEVIVEKDVLHQSIEVREWQISDRIKPFGMQGHKLVSDVLIDNKVSSSIKKDVPILVVDETVMWVAGICFSEDFRVRLASLKPSDELLHIKLS